MKRVRAAVIGATGYGGAEVVRLLENHPLAEVTVATSARLAGTPMQDDCPWLSTDLVLSAFNPERLDVDVAFFAQEAGFAMEHAPALADRGIKVIDLSADFRFADPARYESVYGRAHVAPTVPRVYGLVERARAEIPGHSIVANPGCYPTATILAIGPLVDAGLIGDGLIFIDSKSGFSGAGRSPGGPGYLFSEQTGGFRGYKMVGHRHGPEIEQGLGRKVKFTPHLIPAARGIEVTQCAPWSRQVTTEEVREVLRSAYAGEPFVRVVAEPPSTKQVQGSNRCDIYVEVDPENGLIVLSSVIDNLCKGAGGQAVQNMNVLFGLPEPTGLPTTALWP